MSRFRNFSRHAAEDLENIIGWMLDHGGAAAASERLLTTVPAAGNKSPSGRCVADAGRTCFPTPTDSGRSPAIGC